MQHPLLLLLEVLHCICLSLHLHTCRPPTERESVPPPPSGRFVYESPMPLGRLVRQLADKAQYGTQRSWTRPYGVGLIVAGYDESGA